MPVDIQVGGGHDAGLHPAPGDMGAELGRPVLGDKLGQLAAQGLDRGCSSRAHHRPGLGLFVGDVIDVDHRRAEEHHPLAVGLQQGQPPADGSSRRRWASLTVMRS